MKCDQCGREGTGEYATRSGETILCVSCIGGFFRFRTMAILVGVSLFLILGGIALIGLEGRALSPLRPGGAAEFGDQRLDVITRGDYLASGTPIRIVETISQSAEEGAGEEVLVINPG